MDHVSTHILQGEFGSLPPPRSTSCIFSSVKMPATRLPRLPCAPLPHFLILCAQPCCGYFHSVMVLASFTFICNVIHTYECNSYVIHTFTYSSPQKTMSCWWKDLYIVSLSISPNRILIDVERRKEKIGMVNNIG